ncbi:MAG: hypothetical protein HQ538_01570 [Parcubacteria group bacterium]|nr:hypothetical protein [Parcubacteria group bacterium]
MKVWYKSATLQGNIVTGLGLLIQLFKLPVASDEVSSGISALFVLIGIGYSIYGRITTKGEKLGFKK